MTPEHKSSDADNYEMTKKAIKCFPEVKQWKFSPKAEKKI
jgi:hypothetical protein